jgi:hypothetical protein
MSKETQETIEDDNHLTWNKILMTHFLKDTSRRTPGQQTAFVQMTLKSPQATNQVIREGLIIEGKHVFARKNIPKARRCMKCQGYQGGHFAADCKQLNDTCAHCAGTHHTLKCTKTNGPPLCSNCQCTSHRASDRTCPALKCENAWLITCNPENAYRYLPLINDPSTWELLDSTATATACTRNTTEPGPRPTDNQPAQTPTLNLQNGATGHTGQTGGWNGRARG